MVLSACCGASLFVGLSTCVFRLRGGIQNIGNLREERGRFHPGVLRQQEGSAAVLCKPGAVLPSAEGVKAGSGLCVKPAVHPVRRFGIQQVAAVGGARVRVPEEGDAGVAADRFGTGRNRRIRIVGGEGSLRERLLLPGEAVGQHQRTVLEAAERTEAIGGSGKVGVFQRLPGAGILQEPVGVFMGGGLLEGGGSLGEVLGSQGFLAVFVASLRRIGRRTGAAGEESNCHEEKKGKKQVSYSHAEPHFRIRKALGR